MPDPVDSVQTLIERLLRRRPEVQDAFLKHYWHFCGEQAHLIEVISGVSLTTVVPIHVFKEAREKKIDGTIAVWGPLVCPESVDGIPTNTYRPTAAAIEYLNQGDAKR